MPIDKIVVHCSDTPSSMDIGAQEIHQWHLDRGWDGIGYNAVIRRDGIIEWGRPAWQSGGFWKGSHVKGHNHNSLGVCLVGSDYFTRIQLASLRSVILMWQNWHPNTKVVGHCDLDSGKTCPNFDVSEWWMKSK